MKELILLILFPVVVLIVYIYYRRFQIVKINKSVVANGGISEVRKVKFGGIEQYVSIEGESLNNRICVCIHWSPKYPAPFGVASRGRFSEITKQNIGIFWDPPGKGKSSKKNSKEIEELTLEDFISMANELIDYVRKEFNREKVYFVGVGWGTILGMELVKRYPEKFNGYLAFGQNINAARADEMAYDFMMNYSEEKEDKKSIDELKAIGSPPYKDSKLRRKFMRILEANSNKYLDVLSVDTNRSRVSIVKSILYSPDYNLLDIVSLIGSSRTKYTNIAKEIYRDVNYFESATEIKVPIYFLHGKYDLRSPLDLLLEYYKVLKTPSKGIMILQNSSYKPVNIDLEKLLNHVNNIVASEFKELSRIRKKTSKNNK